MDIDIHLLADLAAVKDTTAHNLVKSSTPVVYLGPGV